MNHIENAFMLETNEFEQKKWELKLNKDNVMVYLKKGGSKYNSE